jgi:hypothetical protein
MNSYFEGILARHLPGILGTDMVAVADDEEEMNWRLFFAHSQDMQGFRADIFTGGPNEARHPHNPSFVGLRDRCGDSRRLIADLARLWEDEAARSELIRLSNPFRQSDGTDRSVRPAIELLRNSGVAGARTFADTLDDLNGGKIARKTRKMVRAYVQNAHFLSQHGCSYRAYLKSILAEEPFPPRDTVRAEAIWIRAISRDFFGVGPTLAPYLICDWILGLWRSGQVDWFECYKPDSVHLSAIRRGCLPPAAAEDFVAFCKTISIPDGFGALSGKPCPPRVLNECIWLEENWSSGAAS